jgi:general secretion pathway protein G
VREELRDVRDREWAGQRPRRGDGQAGFTLIELLVVLVILGLLAAMATPQVLRYLGSSRTDTARIEIRNISTALDLFLVDVGRYPTPQEGLGVLVENPGNVPGWRGPYLRAHSVPLDPWGRPYLYRAPGQRGPYDLFTLGADNTPGGAGENQDVAN